MLDFLRQSTASQTRIIGPFVDDTDFKTLETGLTIANTDIKVMKNGSTAVNKTSGGGTHRVNGMYNVIWDATDTNTVGEMVVSVSVSGALVVVAKYRVLEEDIYDALFDASAAAFDSNQRVNVGSWLGTAVTTSATTNKPEVDVNSISDDATAANNLELMYDGTGYTDDTAPASRQQVDGIGAASGGSLSFAASTDNTGGAIKSITFVGSQTNTFAATEAEDGTYHTIDDTANEIDIVYQFDIGGSRTATGIIFRGYLSSGNDTLNIQAYDFVGADWETRATLTGQAGTDNLTLNVTLLLKHTGTSGADKGLVLIRIQNTGQSNPQLNTDELVVEAVNIGQSVGYANGSIWLDTSLSNTGTEDFVDGVADNPVSTIGAATTLSASLGIKRITVAAGSSFTLASSFANYEIMGNNYTIALGGQSISGAKINGATLSGTFTGTTAILEDCIINAITGPGVTMRRCFFNEVTITNNGTAGWYMNDCRSRVAGSGSPNFDFGVGVGNTAINLRNYSGGIELENMGDTGTDTGSIEGDGQIILNANCDGGSLSYRGNFKFTDNSGNVSVTPTSPVIDVLDQGVAQAGTANTITLAATASATDGQYDPGEVIIVAGTGAGQSRSITDYNGTTKVASIQKDWRTNPDATSSYVVRSTPGQLHVNEGLAQAGTSNTITLNTSGSSVDDVYIGQTIFIGSGTGQDQSRIVTDYNGTTKVATVHKNWNTTPDATSGYVMLPLPSIGDVTVDIQTQIGTAGAGLTDLGGMSTAMKAEVNTEVLDVHNTDTITLPGQAAPPLAPTLRQAIGWLYKVMRNRKTTTSTQWSLLADDESTVDAKATVSDDGTTAIKQEIVSGP